LLPLLQFLSAKKLKKIKKKKIYQFSARSLERKKKNMSPLLRAIFFNSTKSGLKVQKYISEALRHPYELNAAV
jgi:predicted DNA binding CopG/RHH family protein